MERESKLIKDKLHTIEYPFNEEVDIPVTGITLARLHNLLNEYLTSHPLVQDNLPLGLFALAQTNPKTKVDPKEVEKLTDNEDAVLFLENVETIVGLIGIIQDTFILSKKASVQEREVSLSEDTWAAIKAKRESS